jgi:hypothetical protein
MEIEDQLSVDLCTFTFSTFILSFKNIFSVTFNFVQIKCKSYLMMVCVFPCMYFKNLIICKKNSGYKMANVGSCSPKITSYLLYHLRYN